MTMVPLADGRQFEDKDGYLFTLLYPNDVFFNPLDGSMEWPEVVILMDSEEDLQVVYKEAFEENFTEVEHTPDMFMVQ